MGKGSVCNWNLSVFACTENQFIIWHDSISFNFLTPTRKLQIQTMQHASIEISIFGSFHMQQCSQQFSQHAHCTMFTACKMSSKIISVLKRHCHSCVALPLCLCVCVWYIEFTAHIIYLSFCFWWRAVIEQTNERMNQRRVEYAIDSSSTILPILQTVWKSNLTFSKLHK